MGVFLVTNNNPSVVQSQNVRRGGNDTSVIAVGVCDIGDRGAVGATMVEIQMSQSSHGDVQANFFIA